MAEKATKSKEDFSHLMFRVYSGLHGSLFRTLTPTAGLGRPEFGLLALLHGTGGSSQSEAAEKCHMAKSQLSLIVERLVEKGLVERIKDNEDRRMAHIKATREGEKALATAFAGMRLRIDEYFAPLGTDEIKTVRKALELMAEIMDREEDKQKHP